MAENRFAKSVKAAKQNTEQRQLEKEQEKEVSTTIEDLKIKSEGENSEILNELFPKSNKDSNFKAHSVYLNDLHWKKIQRIARDQGISNSAVITKILEKVL